MGFSLLDLIYPRLCLGCQRPGEYLCSECLNQVASLTRTICPICHSPSSFGLTHARCQKRYALNGLTAFFPYSGLIKKAIKKHKFKRVSQLTTEMIELCISLGDWTIISNSQWLLIPIPLHQRRLKWRGFNQSSLLASSLATYLSQPYSDAILSRTRNTPPQSQLKGEARKHNLANAFAMTPLGLEIARDHSATKILLIDDVYTTGSTLKEAASTLKRGGFSYVWGCTMARSRAVVNGVNY